MEDHLISLSPNEIDCSTERDPSGEDTCFLIFTVLSLGFPGFEIRYSETMANISVTLSAHCGTLVLSSMPIQVWHPMWTGRSVRYEDRDLKELILEVSVEVINLAFQSIQYLGNDNFYGEDTIRVCRKHEWEK